MKIIASISSEKQTLFWVVKLILLTACNHALAASTSDNVITFPNGDCHALRRPLNNVFANLNQKQYTGIQSQQRWDIVCIGDSLRIDTPVRSNGGDIVIYANKLEIAAPIDSRPYLSPDDVHPYIESPRSQANFATPDTDLRRIFDDYYRRSIDAIVVKDKTYLPELPSGLTGEGYRGCEPPLTDDAGARPPTNAPAVADADGRMRPGNIVVYANQYEFDYESLKKYPLFDGDPLVCPISNQISVGNAFVARGLRGGRGGAGGTRAYFYDRGTAVRNVRFRCGENAYQWGGFLNAAGGDGGEGGTVELFIVGRQVSPDLRRTLEERTSVHGGVPGSHQKLRSPAWRGPEAATSNDVCGLRNEGVWPKAKKGKDGTIEIASLSQTDAILNFARAIVARDSRLDYSFEDLISRATDPKEKIKGFTYNSFAERKFYELLILKQLDWLERLNISIALGSENHSPILEGVWTSIEAARLDESVFSNEAAQPLRLMTTFTSRPGFGPVHSYFYNTGGLLNLRSASALSQWSALAMRTEATLSEIKLDQIRSTLAVIAEGVNDIREVARTSEFKSRLAGLNEQVRITREAADKASATHSIESIVAGVKDVAEGIVMLYASEGIADSGAGAMKLYRGIRTLSTALSSTPNYDQQIILLKRAIADLIVDYDRFIQYSSAVKSKILAEQRQSVVDYFESNSSYGARLQARTVLFHDMIRSILIGHVIDPSKNRIELRTNLVAIYNLLRDYPAREPALSFRDFDLTCEPSQITRSKCTRVEANPTWRILISTASDWMNNWPLYVLAPTAQPTELPSFGLEWKPSQMMTQPQTMTSGYKTLGGGSISDTKNRALPEIDIQWRPR